MSLYSDIIAEARVLLQDLTVPYRYSDAELLVGANDVIKIIRKVRPDIFFGKYGTVIADAALTDTFPIGAEYKSAVREYVIGYAELRDSEDASNSRAALFMGLADKMITSL